MRQTVKITTITLNPTIDHTVFIPHFQAGKVNRVTGQQFDPGGKGVNVASVLADFGFSVTVTGFLGEDNARIFEEMFARKKIVDRFVRIAGSTRSNVKIVDETIRATTDINFPGQPPAPADMEALLPVVAALAAESDWFVLSGSIPAGVSPNVYGQLVELIKAQGCAVALDTSGEALRQALPAAPTLIKPNLEELQELAGQTLPTRQEVVRVARRWLERGIQTIVVSMGAEGAIFMAGDDVLLAQPPEVTVKSTVGAGDAMVSGTVAGLAQGLSLAECARLAAAFAAAAVSRVGSGLPSPAVLEDFKDQVMVKSFS